jgi:transcriptional regulator of NAD metabolism
MFWEKPSGSIRAVFAVKHADAPNIVEAELLTMVQSGVTVVNVIVAHPLYGELVGNLNLSTGEDVLRFIHNMQELSAVLLSRLTDGVHLHTVEGKPDDIDRARRALSEGGFLLKAT